MFIYLSKLWKKYLSNNLHTKGKYFQKRKEKTEKKKRESLFFRADSLRGQAFFGKYYSL